MRVSGETNSQSEAKFCIKPMREQRNWDCPKSKLKIKICPLISPSMAWDYGVPAQKFPEAEFKEFKPHR